MQKEGETGPIYIIIPVASWGDLPCNQLATNLQPEKLPLLGANLGKMKEKKLYRKDAKKLYCIDMARNEAIFCQLDAFPGNAYSGRQVNAVALMAPAVGQDGIWKDAAQMEAATKGIHAAEFWKPWHAQRLAVEMFVSNCSEAYAAVNAVLNPER